MAENNQLEDDGPNDGYVVRFYDGPKPLMTKMYPTKPVSEVIDLTKVLLIAYGDGHPNLRATIIERRTIDSFTFRSITAPGHERIDLND